MNKSISRLVGGFLAIGFLAFSAAAVAAPVDLQILSATVKDQAIAGAEVLLQKNGEQSVHGSSDLSGRVRAESARFSADDPLAILIIKKPGYSTLVAKCPCNHLTYAISPVMTQLDGMRIVLSWSETPTDVDAHLVFGDSHIYWRQKDGSDAELDVDAQAGFGPETITIQRRHPGQRYVYAVHNYVDRDNVGTSTLEKGRTRVQVYVGRTLVRSYYIDPNKIGNLWTVFAVTENGDLEDINQYSDESDPENVGKSLVGRLTGTLQTSPVDISAADKAQAVAINHEGEVAYRSRDFDSAIHLFQQAIEINGEFGQAYSNLGLTFEKAGNEAEAIWADRKAIALASGSDAARVRASSYYNIGRIYEGKSEWYSASAAFQAAENEKHNEIYVKAIARMKTKLQ